MGLDERVLFTCFFALIKSLVIVEIAHGSAELLSLGYNDRRKMINYQLDVFFNESDFSIEKVEHNNNKIFFDEKLFENFKKAKFKTLYDFAFFAENKLMLPSLHFLYKFSNIFVRETSFDSDIEVNKAAKGIEDSVILEILQLVPFAVGAEYINVTWVKNIWDELSQIFNEEIATFSGSVQDYFKQKDAKLNVAGRVFFHLVESKREEYPFAFLATYSTKENEELTHLPLKNALTEYQGDQDKLLSLLASVSKAANNSQLISELMESGELFSPIRFTKDEAYTFLQELPIYEESGIVCRIPNWWKRNTRTKLSLAVGEVSPAKVGIDALVSFRPEVHLGDVTLTLEEVQNVLSQTSGLSFIKGKWVEVDPKRLEEIQKAFNNMQKDGEVTLADAMRLQLGLADDFGGGTEEEVEVTNGEWLQSVKEKLINPGKIENLFPTKSFKAKLRHYQQTGLNWLYFMKNLGFGALLADDMGLGKTIQILALLDYLREQSLKTLLVVPASLICNWQQEIEKFAPNLKATILLDETFNTEEYDLFIVTYNRVSRIEKLKKIQWDLLILDEAQAIKNANTKQTKAVKSLEANYKIAMTGTPIENRLVDLWSIFDFLNKGLLGNRKEFTNFAKKLKVDLSGYSTVKNVVNPFILRRLKTDKKIISDLPEKIELKSFTSLTRKQVVLYKALVKELETVLDDSDEMAAIKRRGIVLASLMKFKQICNHPDQYLGQQEYDFQLSGKFKKLGEICEIIRDKRERVLVFTQFKEMTKPIADFLSKIFGREGLVLHGSTTVKKRGELVDKFNGEAYVPFMVLSLKAGGVGLNLTAANHVVHFDRWWNPAIENQATDRVFRIGQKKNVVVHKFITNGTIEEKIDEMLEEKQKLSDDIIASSGENWLTEMDNKKLLNLFKLEV
ncbi:MAG: DEAD/DEAH box helicase [Streptococcaceae bacterium]|nr:DEAD/DEAH box helicase [Streptococcaceae bacterium]